MSTFEKLVQRQTRRAPSPRVRGGIVISGKVGHFRTDPLGIHSYVHEGGGKGSSDVPGMSQRPGSPAIRRLNWITVSPPPTNLKTKALWTAPR